MDKILQYILVAAAAVIAVALIVISATSVIRYIHETRRSAKLEAKVIADSKKLVWRIVNTGGRNISIVEIGVKCGDKSVYYRPLYSANEDINNIPALLYPGEIASYRKEMERFAFKQAEIDELKVSNPDVYFYVKDAEGKMYSVKSEYKFAQYLTLLIGGSK